ncbi:MAG: 2-C-methyl-D-erythritol 4-phosphate cytidylyltransferase [Elusimicrobia bacterium RIFOXYA2_FULL_40_6]|nr:MAG: 2-C-methyl-D-erythritol 4-phosphate cytidylyltransferase [Elusimicrobia bacterium RIFOXYA2_FULL_40_6]
MFISSIIVAGGSGKRFGSKKQYHQLNGKPVVLWAIEKFAQVSDEVILILPKEDIKYFQQKWGKKYPALKIYGGGKERRQSVENGLNKISTEARLVAIHDGARPLISKTDIQSCIRAASKHGAAICAVAASDTVKLSDNSGNIKQTIDRKKVFLAQTPQIFKRNIILEAFKRKKLLNCTDDAQMVEVTGKKVRLVSTTSPNIKITTKADILIAEKLINRGSF